MESEKLPFSTLVKMERGELPMTEEGQVQLAQLSERVRAALPNTAALQLWTQQHTFQFSAIQNALARLPKLTGSINIGASLPGLNIGQVTADIAKIHQFAIPFVPTWTVGINRAIELLRPFTEHLKKVSEKYKELKSTALEVYENEKELYYKEYGIRVPYEDFWHWFIRKHDDWTIWELIDTATYSSIGEDYSRYIAEMRYKRIKDQQVHFEMISSETINISPSPEPAFMQSSEYVTTKEFREGPNVKHCSELVDQRFGFIFKGIPFYSGLALAIIENSRLNVRQRLDDENNPHQFKFVDTTIDGVSYLGAYKEGYKKGIEYFEKEYPSSAAYGPFADDYAANLHRHYKHGPKNSGVGWEWNGRAHNQFITLAAFSDYGYYAGLCYSIDCLAGKHLHLSDTLYTCNYTDTSKEISKQLTTLDRKRKSVQIDYKSLIDVFVNSTEMDDCVAALHKIDKPVINDEGDWIGKKRGSNSSISILVAWIEILELRKKIRPQIDRCHLAVLLNQHFPGLNMGTKDPGMFNKPNDIQQQYRIVFLTMIK